jgi:peptidoglycan/xylan/chitin deacetylase (PgdA/CDA1 family)
MLLAVGYHYVAERAPEKPRAIFPVTTEALAKQIELLSRDYELVSRDELVAAVTGDADLPDRACVLTFDDGLRCQYELALPALEQLGAPAIFFVPGRPIAERRVLEVHKLHALRERLADEELRARLPDGLPEVSTDEAQAHYRYDTPEAAALKFLLNIRLPAGRRRELVDSLFATEFPDESAVADELYMDGDQVAELEREHHAVGAHSYAHQPLATLSNGDLEDDLERVTLLLEEIMGSRPRAFSYPYGTPETVDARTTAAVGAAGYGVAFTMRRDVNHSLDEPLLLARLDTNDAPGGTRPILGEPRGPDRTASA